MDRGADPDGAPTPPGAGPGPDPDSGLDRGPGPARDLSPGPAGQASPYAPPVKRSVTIAGHQTAISLEPIFWDALRRAAAGRGLPVNALIARIDVERIAAPDPPNLTSAIRCWLFRCEAATSCETFLSLSQ